MAQTPVTRPSPVGMGEPWVEWNWGCSLIATPHQLQHEGEDVDDVRVDLQGASDVVLWADGVLPVPQDQLRVIRQELQGQAQVRTQGHSARTCLRRADLSPEPLCRAAVCSGDALVSGTTHSLCPQSLQRKRGALSLQCGLPSAAQRAAGTRAGGGAQKVSERDLFTGGEGRAQSCSIRSAPPLPPLTPSRGQVLTHQGEANGPQSSIDHVEPVNLGRGNGWC